MTTNSTSGVTTYAEFFPVFAAMEKYDLVLNLHGEVPSDPGSDITELNAEEAFLPTLIMLHQRFPNLRIVLEHCTSAAALAAVHWLLCVLVARPLPVRCTTRTLTTMLILRADRPVATVTAHHLYLTFQHCCDPFAFCKPVPKMPADRDALIRAVCSGDPKFFL